MNFSCLQGAYFICASHRSGSNYFCELLERSGMAGKPEEYFAQEFFPDWFEMFGGASFSEYLPRVIQATSDPNGIFGVKIMGGRHFHEFLSLCKQLPAYTDRQIASHEILAEMFPGLKYIWLTRRNKIRQAISFSKALQTRIWRSDYRDSRTQKEKGRFSIKHINYCLLTLLEEEASWQSYFRQANIVPFTVVYEDFIRFPEHTVRHVLDYLGISIPATWKLENVKQRKLADATSEKWVERYLHYIQHECAAFEEMGMPSPDTFLTSDSSPFVDEHTVLLEDITAEEMTHHIASGILVKALCLKIANKQEFNWLHSVWRFGKRLCGMFEKAARSENSH